MTLSLSYVDRQEVSARIQQEKQLAALEAQQAEMQRKRDSPQHRDIHRSSSPGQQKSADQVMPTSQEDSEDMVLMLDFIFTLLIFKKREICTICIIPLVINLLVLILLSKTFFSLPFSLPHFTCNSTLTSADRKCIQPCDPLHSTHALVSFQEKVNCL
jgi:hypothetical protein